MSVKIQVLCASLTVRPSRHLREHRDEKPIMDLELHSSMIQVWDLTTGDDQTSDYYKFTERDGTGFYKKVADLPYLRQVYRYLAEQYAANRSNPVGEFVKLSVDALEAALSETEGSSVYFAQSASRIKIGWSRKVATRLAQLQTGNAEPIKLLGTVPGGRAREQEIQRQFAHCRVNGEWFEATPDLLEFIGSAS